MNEFVMPLPLSLDVVSLTMSLVNIASASHDEEAIADSVEAALHPLRHLEVERLGNTVVARTDLGRPERIVIAGHLDTVPADDDVLAYVEMGKLFGAGACDMKGGLAVMLKTATLGDYGRDVTFVFHEGGEQPGEAGGLDGLARTRPELFEGDLVVLAEPSDAGVRVRSTTDLDRPLVAALVQEADRADAEADEAVGCPGTVASAALGVPVIRFGPGDPALAHQEGEYVPTVQLTECEHVLRAWLRG